MDPLVNRPNHIVERQKLYQSQAALPVYLRGPRSKAYFKAYLALFAVGLGGALWDTGRYVVGSRDS